MLYFVFFVIHLPVMLGMIFSASAKTPSINIYIIYHIYIHNSTYHSDAHSSFKKGSVALSEC